MNTFFKELAETLKDRQEFQMNIKKIDGDLVATIVLDIKEGTSNIEMSGKPEEMDENFLTEILKPLSVETTFTSNADEVKKELEEEELTPKDKIKALGEDKKSPVKKGKTKSKKPAEKPVVDKAHEKELEETKQDDSESEINQEENNQQEELPEVIDQTEIAEEQKIEVGEEQTETPIETKVEEADSDDAPPSPKEVFEHLIAEGDKMFGLRDYAGAEASYKKALEIFPEDDKAKKLAKKANQWVEALKNI